MKQLLICIDFHKQTDLLIEKALDYAKEFKAKIYLLHVAAPDPDFVGYEAGPQSERDFRAKTLKEEHALLAEFAEDYKKAGLDTEPLLIQGATIESIIDKSKELNIDLIISGSHQHGFFHQLFYGDTSSTLMHQSKIPMLIIPLD